MGMFDSIKINSDKLPVSVAEKELLKDAVFQTKDLEQCLLMYVISDSGELLLSEFADEKNKKENIPVMFLEEYFTDFKQEKVIYTKTAFHGYIRFYTSADKTWYEFRAKFTDDKLVSLERISKND
jgi:hypothetical protein